jgi:hypothetical protein
MFRTSPSSRFQSNAVASGQTHAHLDLAEYYTNHNYGGFKIGPFLNVYN